MNHTYIRKAPAPEPVEKTENFEDGEEAQTPKDAVWKKYMALASGTAGVEDETEKGPQAPKKPTKPTLTKATNEQEQAPKPTGFAAILQDYQNTKTQRSQMKSIQMSKPSVEKPTAPTVQ